ncbi:thiamine pyrophosphate-binding protein [Halomarina ordinaria]|uniref:Thiamine pyrophosphate-binding protein n=1 Tax=Halomarina ordinaria TaxID=3033939 RepID=A0ABD5UB17_9EURY|nr:thiamine pyrophosphate-binding protein [Halomarina sp. PSRA2]
MTDTDGYTGADLFVDTLESYGVTHVFGNPGTTELPVLEALSGSDLEYILGLHEDVAVGMASGYAQTRRYHSHHDEDVLPAGVVNLHITPGLAHGLGNVYAARWVGAPIVVTAGNHELDFRHEEPLLSGELREMVKQFTKFDAEVTDVRALPGLLRRAFRIALTPPTGPVFLGLPMDVMLAETDLDPEPLGPIPTGGRGDAAQIAEAADLLADAEAPVFVLGDEVARSGHEAVAAAVDLAEACGARVHGEMLACEVNFPTDHEQWVSHIPPQEGFASMLMNSDTLAFVGCSTNTTLLRHEDPLVPESATCVHVGTNARDLAKHHPADAAVIGDPGAVLADLADRVGERVDEATREERVEQVRQVKESLAGTMDKIGRGDADPDDPRASKAELVDALKSVAPDAFVVDEGITAKYPLLLRWPMQAEGLLSNKGGGLGYGLPASVGAAIAEREAGSDRRVVGYVGDGSYLYYPHTLYSAARHDVDLTVVVPDNRNYRILKDNTNAIFGGDDADHDYVGMDFEPPVDIPKNAESHGATGVLVEERDDIEAAFEEALSTEGPVVLDVLVHD